LKGNAYYCIQLHIQAMSEDKLFRRAFNWLEDIVLTPTVGLILLADTTIATIATYYAINATDSRLQEKFGTLGYHILEKGTPVLVGLAGMYITYIGTRATHEYFKKRKQNNT